MNLLNLRWARVALIICLFMFYTHFSACPSSDSSWEAEFFIEVGPPVGSELCNLCLFNTVRQGKTLFHFSESFGSLSSPLINIVYNFHNILIEKLSAFMLSSLTLLSIRTLLTPVSKVHVFSHTAIQNTCWFLWLSTAVLFSSPVPTTQASFHPHRSRNILKEVAALHLLTSPHSPSLECRAFIITSAAFCCL